MSAPARSTLPFPRWLLLGVFPALALAYAAFDSSPFLGGEMSRGQVIGRDFAIFWGASVLLWRGDVLAWFDSSLFMPALDQIMGVKLAFMPYPYPPNSIFIVWPLGLLPYGAALPLWLGATFAFLAALLRRIELPWLLIAALLLSPASIVNICSGQNGFLSAALLCGGLLLLERRPMLAGILIGFLTFKPQFGLLVPLLLIAGGHWRSFAAASATVLLLVLGSLLAVGADGWWLYLTTSTPQQIHFVQNGSGFFQQMSFTYLMNARLLGIDAGAAWVLHWTLAALIGLAAIWMFRQKAPHELKVAAALVAAALLPPHAQTYDLVIISVAILLAGRNGPWRPAAQGIFAFAWILPVMTILPMPPITAGVLTLLFVVLCCRVLAMARAGA